MKSTRVLFKTCVLLSMVVCAFLFQNCGQKFTSTTEEQIALASSMGAVNNNSGSGSTDSGTNSGGGTTPDPNADKVWVMMLQGHMGRTAMSCDEGKTWINDMSDDDTARCWLADTTDPHYVECDHHVSAGHGITFGQNGIWTNFGWGYNGSVRHSMDGKTWQKIKTDGWGGGIAYVQDQLYLLWSWAYHQTGMVSLDGGTTWANMQNAAIDGGFDHPNLQVSNGVMAILDPASGLGLSSNGGLDWTIPTTYQKVWATSGNFINQNGIMLTVGNALSAGNTNMLVYVSKSTDQGATWTSQTLQFPSNSRVSPVFFDGAKFFFFAGTSKMSSTDGSNWSSSTTTGYFSSFMYQTPSGALITMVNDWGSWYDKQFAYRSTDGGATWVKLDTAHYKGGHPLKGISGGYMDKSVCP